MPDMTNLFRSERLEYRAVEDTHEDRVLMEAIQSDADAFAHSDDGLLRPVSLKTSKEYADYVANQTLIGVIIRTASELGTQDIGSLHLTSLKPDRAQHRHAYIGIDIRRHHQGNGYGAEAINWALDWGFKQAGLHRIGVEAFSYNEGAMRLYERLGFVLEGRKRESLWFNGGWHDLVSYSMLEDEWRELRRQGKGVNKFAV